MRKKRGHSPTCPLPNMPSGVSRHSDCFHSSGYITTAYQGKELKEPYKATCQKCGQLVNIPISCGNGTIVYCNNCSQQTWYELDCEIKGLNVDMKKLYQSETPIGGTGTMMLCMNGTFIRGATFDGVCTKYIAQIIEKMQHLPARDEQEDTHRKEYKYS